MPAERSRFTVDLGAVRANARRLVSVLGRSELWAVVKANGYGHGAADAGRAALEGGATALCVATVAEALELRPAFPAARLIVLGPAGPADVEPARAARLELTVSGGVVPEGVPVHLKLDTGMGRWGFAELPGPGANVAGVMTHFAPRTRTRRSRGSSSTASSPPRRRTRAPRGTRRTAPPR
jgi:alanine racemase